MWIRNLGVAELAVLAQGFSWKCGQNVGWRSSLGAGWLEDPVLSLWQLRLLLWCGFDPWSQNFCMPQVWLKKKKKMLAGASVIWSFACIQSCFDCFQDGSHMWLLAEGLSFLLHMPLHRAVWVWSQQGCWLPSRVWSKSLKWEWGERKLQGLLWPSFRSYVLSLLAYPIPWDKVTKSKPSSRGEELSSISWMEEYQWSVGIFKTHHR